MRKAAWFGAVVLLFFLLWRAVLGNIVWQRGSKVTHSGTVFLGDSRMNYLYRSPDNYGITAEPIVYSYYKAKYILSQRTLDTIVLAFGYNSLSSYYNAFVTNPDIVERYYLLLPGSMQRKYFTAVKHPRILYYRTIEWVLYGATIAGGYNDPPANRYFTEKECNKRLKEQYEGQTLCVDNIDYLDSVRQLCTARGVQLILMNPPAHPYYEARVPRFFVNEYKNIVANYTLWDFSREMAEDSLFLPDGDHITVRGTAIMTQKIDSMRALATK